LNVNQTQWIGNAPNPISLKLLGVETTPERVLDCVSRHLSERYRALRRDKSSAIEALHDRYMARLYRRSGFYPYYDPASDEHFDAEIIGIDPQGPLVLELPTGEVRRYWFKEVRFVLPCGVTKE